MTTNQPLIECIPNFSEGRDPDTIWAIRNAIEQVAGQKLLHIDSSPSANRTVFTFAGSPESVVEAAFQAIKTATDRIDMRLQKGAHPRIGATDVCPLVPLAHISMQETIALSEELAKRLGATLQIPVYLYEYSARADYRRFLPDIRKGQYEQLYTRMQTPEWRPDYGPEIKSSQDMEKTGATVVGARNILVAFNISLDTTDERIARSIAKKMRSSNQEGLLPALRAIGWYMDDFKCAQVSMNLLDYRITSPLQAWNTCTDLAASLGVQTMGCEVVGLIPESCILEAGYHALSPGSQEKDTLDRATLIKAGIDYLKLNQVKPFIPAEKILEYRLAAAGLLDYPAAR